MYVVFANGKLKGVFATKEEANKYKELLGLQNFRNLVVIKDDSKISH